MAKQTELYSELDRGGGWYGIGHADNGRDLPDYPRRQLLFATFARSVSRNRAQAIESLDLPHNPDRGHLERPSTFHLSIGDMFQPVRSRASSAP